MGYPIKPPTYGRKPPCYGPTGGIGDIGGDGRVDATDIALMLKLSTGDLVLSGREKIRADLDGNGEPGCAVDVATMLKFTSGDIDTFPVCAKKGYPTEPPTYGRKPPCYGPTGGIGDIGGEGRVDATDIASMIKLSTGDIVLSGREKIRADLDGNGDAGDAVDLALMLKFTSGDITTFPVCEKILPTGIDPVTTPDMRSLEPGTYNIVISKSGYDTVYAKITVSSTGTVTCNDVTGVTGCGTDYPRVIASGNNVKVHMAGAGTAPSGYTEWIANQGGATGLRSNLGSIGSIIDGYLSSPGEGGYLGFTVVLANIGATIDYYLG